MPTSMTPPATVGSQPPAAVGGSQDSSPPQFAAAARGVGGAGAGEGEEVEEDADLVVDDFWFPRDTCTDAGTQFACFLLVQK